MALHVVLPALKEVSIFDLNAGRAQKLADEMQRLYNRTNFIVAPSAEASVRGADVVVTVTSGVSLGRAYLEANWLKEGVLVSTVAANDSKIEVVVQADNGADQRGRVGQSDLAGRTGSGQGPAVERRSCGMNRSGRRLSRTGERRW